MKTTIATLALIIQDGKLLLGRKIRKGADIGEATLNGPGGKVDPGQTLFACLATEVYDEVGLTVLEEDTEEIAIVTFHNGKRSVWRVHVYLVFAFTGNPRDSDEMVVPAGGWWYRFDTLPFDQMLASDHEWIPRALMGLHFRAHVYQNADGTKLRKKKPIEFLAY